MKFLKYSLISIVSLLLLMLVISFFLSKEMRTERSIHVNAKPSTIFPIINNFKQWKIWSPWHQKDTATLYTFGEIETGKGAKLDWNSNHPDVGKGTLFIEDSRLDSVVDFVLEMKNAGKAYSRVLLTPTDSGTLINWSFYKSTDGMPIWAVPFTKIIMPFMEGFIGPNFENGLLNIKKYLESNPLISIGNYDAEIREFGGLNYVGIRSKIKGADIGATLEKQYATLLEELKKKNIQCTGNPFTINYFAKGDTFDMMAAIPCSEPNSYNPPVVSASLAPNKWLVVKYFGSYEQIGPIYSKGFEYLAHQKYKPVGAPMEFYFTDPTTEPDTSKWYTELVFPFME